MLAGCYESQNGQGVSSRTIETRALTTTKSFRYYERRLEELRHRADQGSRCDNIVTSENIANRKADQKHGAG